MSREFRVLSGASDKDLELFRGFQDEVLFILLEDRIVLFVERSLKEVEEPLG